MKKILTGFIQVVAIVLLTLIVKSISLGLGILASYSSPDSMVEVLLGYTVGMLLSTEVIVSLFFLVIVIRLNESKSILQKISVILLIFIAVLLGLYISGQLFKMPKTLLTILEIILAVVEFGIFIFEVSVTIIIFGKLVTAKSKIKKVINFAYMATIFLDTLIPASIVGISAFSVITKFVK